MFYVLYYHGSLYIIKHYNYNKTDDRKIYQYRINSCVIDPLSPIRNFDTHAAKGLRVFVIIHFYIILNPYYTFNLLYLFYSLKCISK